MHRLPTQLIALVVLATVFAIPVAGQSAAPAYDPPLDIGVVLYDGAEPLDVFGPIEMWLNAGPGLIRVHLIADSARPVALTTTTYPAEMAPKVEAQYSYDEAPPLDVIMVPGGIGTLREVENQQLLDFVAERAAEVQLTTSVCTGSAILAKAGVLDGLPATGNKAFFSYIAGFGPETEWVEEARWVDAGHVMTSSGVSAGIDMSLAVVARFFGRDAARMLAQATEYEWNEDAGRDPFVGNLDSAMPYLERMEAAVEESSGSGFRE